MKRKRFFIIFAAAVCVFVVFRDSKSNVAYYVKNNQNKLESFVENVIETNDLSTKTTYNGWDVFYRKEANMVEFITFAFGIAPSSTYKGFYYSPNDTPLGFQGVNLTFTKNDTGWVYNDGNNIEYTEKVMDHWYWFEMNF